MATSPESTTVTTFTAPSLESTAEISAAYARDGFVLIRGALSQDNLAELRRYVDAVERMDPFPESLDVYYEQSSRGGPHMVRQIENVCSVHRPLYQLADDWPRTWAGVLLGSEAVLFKDKINYKHSGGGGYRAHRDGRFWWRCPQTGEWRRGWEYYATDFVSVAVFADPADTNNGCIEVVRGKHTPSAVGPEYGALQDSEASVMHFEPIPSAAGDVLFFDALTPHRSGSNNSGDSRCVLYLTYNRSSEGDYREAYFRDKRLSLAAQGGAQANR